MYFLQIEPLAKEIKNVYGHLTRKTIDIKTNERFLEFQVELQAIQLTTFANKWILPKERKDRSAIAKQSKK